MSDTDDKVPTTVKQDLVQLDKVFDNTNSNREVIAEKLRSTIDEIQLSKDDPKLISAQMGIINTYLNVLNGKEANLSRRVTSKLKQLETETASKHSAAVAELLSKISVNGTNLNIGSPSLNHDEIERQVEDAFVSSGLDPILATELKTDPKDLHDA